MKGGPAFAAAVIVFLGAASAVHAHRLDEYLQATLVAIDPEDIILRINLTPGVDVASKVVAVIDRDRDAVVSAEEAATYAASVRTDLAVLLDGRNIEMKLTGSTFPEPADLREGLGIIQMEFCGSPGRLAPGMHKLRVDNRHSPAASVYLFNATAPKSASIRIASQNRNEEQTMGEIEFSYEAPTQGFQHSGYRAGAAALLTAVMTAVGWWIRKITARKRLTDT